MSNVNLTAVLLPNDAAAILESQIPMLDLLEQAGTEQDRQEALARLRAWLVGTSSALRQADPRSQGKAPPTTPEATQAPPTIGTPAASGGKKPCGCPEPRGPFVRQVPEPVTAREFGELFGKYFVRKFGL